jgi:hypothetical protein
MTHVQGDEADKPAHEIGPYEAADSEAWDELVRRSVNGTFLHTRRFISYHGDRFTDRSLVVRSPRGEIVAVFPAADVEGEPGTITSHPGLTYGGLVHDGSLRGEATIRAIAAIANRYRAEGADLLRYKAIPTIYHRVPACDDLYALFRLRADRFRCDLSATVDLTQPRRVSHGRKTALKRAAKAGVELCDSWEWAPEYWVVLAQNIGRHKSAPTHSLADIELLHDLFPDKISLLSARLRGEVVAGTVLFDARPVLHTQYIASNDTGRDASAVDLVISAAIDRAAEQGYGAFDFGISTEQGGWYLNDTLHGFKASFGAGAVLYEHFELALPSSDPA